eukprot:4255305-Pyramimonas_sp.AAC.1
MCVVRAPRWPTPPPLSAGAIGLSQVALHGEDCDPWPTQPGTCQWADINQSLRFHLGADGNGSVFRNAMPTLTTKTILMLR